MIETGIVRLVRSDGVGVGYQLGNRVMMFGGPPIWQTLAMLPKPKPRTPEPSTLNDLLENPFDPPDPHRGLPIVFGSKMVKCPNCGHSKGSFDKPVLTGLNYCMWCETSFEVRPFTR